MDTIDKATRSKIMSHVGQKNAHPELFEKAKAFEKIATETGERFTWNEGSSFFCLLCVNFLVMISVAIAFLIIFKISSEAVPYISDCIDGKIPCDWNAGLSYTWRHLQSSVWSSTGNAAAMIQKWWFKS